MPYGSKDTGRLEKVIPLLMGGVMMCQFFGMPVGEYCACCQECAEYLSVCAPVVGYGGYVTAECDFDFCGYCPHYGECEELWGDGQCV